MTDVPLEECTRCGWWLHHLQRGICAWCEDELRGGKGTIVYNNYAAHAGEETSKSAVLMAKRLANRNRKPPIPHEP